MSGEGMPEGMRGTAFCYSTPPEISFENFPKSHSGKFIATSGEEEKRGFFYIKSNSLCA